MAFTKLTVQNLTTVGIGGANAAENLFTPGPQEIGRYRFRLVRIVVAGSGVGDTVTLTGITPQRVAGTPTETQVLWSFVSKGANTIDQMSFPDQHEFRGRIQIASVSAGGTLDATLFLHHG